MLPISTLPTIWDRLADHSLSRKYYFSDFPFLALWGTRYVNISHPVADFFADCAAGNLPAVSFGGAFPIAAPQTEAELPPDQLMDTAKSLGFPVPS